MDVTNFGEGSIAKKVVYRGDPDKLMYCSICGVLVKPTDGDKCIACGAAFAEVEVRT